MFQICTNFEPVEAKKSVETQAGKTCLLSTDTHLSADEGLVRVEGG